MGVWQLVVLVCSFLAFAFLGIPIFIGMGLAAVVYCTIFWGSSSFITIAAEMVEFLNNFGAADPKSFTGALNPAEI